MKQKQASLDVPSGAGGIFLPTTQLRASKLVLKDGTVFKGQLLGSDQDFTGEVVFNTGMTGYVESLTDPSYSNQILVFTYPLIGNYGVQHLDMESGAIQVAGVIMSELAEGAHHDQAQQSFASWLHSYNVPLLTGVDTRALTKYLRKQGTMQGRVGKKLLAKNNKQRPELARPIMHNETGKKTIILVDCGAKGNILRSLEQMNMRIKQVPHDYDYTNDTYDGVLISNGPGDPTDYKQTIAITTKALRHKKPVFGICLGSQIMGLAAGAKTYKLRFGHRGHNQPCIADESMRCYITSQNHGYAIDEKTLPKSWKVTFRNLNDDSVEGIAHSTKPFFAVQFHPEACPGPTDTAWLFKDFQAVL